MCVSLLVLSQYVDHNGEEGVVVGVERLSNGDLCQGVGGPSSVCFSTSVRSV